MTQTKLNRSQINFFPQALEAVVEEPCSKGGRIRIKCHGVYYRAEHYDSHHKSGLYTGQRVFMVGIRENVALITFQNPINTLLPTKL